MNRFYVALQARYQAQIEEALAVLDLYFNKSVGVGEHPDVLSVLDEHVTMLDEAKSKLETISVLFENSKQAEETK